jgi:hypothetical protein
MANEQAVFSISDLWVANATREADDQYSQVDYEESVFDDEESRIGGTESRTDDDSHINLEAEPDFFGYGSAPPSIEDLRGHARQEELQSGQASPSLTVPGARTAGLERSKTPSRDRLHSPARGDRERVVSYGGGGLARLRRGSVASSAARGAPSIFANTGLEPVAHAPPPPPASKAPDESAFTSLGAIPESRSASMIEHDLGSPGDAQSIDEKPEPSPIRQLPLSMIAQYSLLALHGCTCDQVFM